MADNKRVVIEIHTEKTINDRELRAFANFIVANAFNKLAYESTEPMEMIAYRKDKQDDKIHRLIQRAQRKLRLKEKTDE
jgi:hypothetical protein